MLVGFLCFIIGSKISSSRHFFFGSSSVNLSAEFSFYIFVNRRSLKIMPSTFSYVFVLFLLYGVFPLFSYSTTGYLFFLPPSSFKQINFPPKSGNSNLFTRENARRGRKNTSFMRAYCLFGRRTGM